MLVRVGKAHSPVLLVASINERFQEVVRLAAIDPEQSYTGDVQDTCKKVSEAL
jgi:hypothetical protein